MGRLLLRAFAVSAALCVHGPAAAAEARAQLEGDLDPDLRAAIQRAIGETGDKIETRFEARRRARAAAEDAIAVLRSEGYYAYVVEPDVSETDPPIPLVRIAPGPRFRLGQPAIQWQGQAPDADTEARVRRALDLEPGEPGRAAEVVAAEGRIVATLQGRGYADAVAQPREVIVDHADSSLTPSYRIQAGGLVRLNGLEITTDGRTRAEWVRRLAPWTPGEAYDPEDVAELERRLLDTGVYDSVTVALAPATKATAEGLRPVVVSLAERKRRTIEAGASYSTSEGAGVDVRWTRYNVLGRADTLSLLGRLSDKDTRAQAELTLPHWRRAQQTLRLGAAAYDVSTDAYDETGFGVRGDITRRYGKTSYVTMGGSVDASRTKEREEEDLSKLGRDLVTIAALGDLLLDRSNDPLDPRQGWKLSARAEPTVILGEENLPYLRLQVQGTGYVPLDKQGRTVVAGRLKVGRIVNGTVPEVPASRRFYAGGGGSVRGFPYQAVGPRLADGTPRGGTSLFEASAEVRRDLTPRWGFAAFVDAGSVGSEGAIDFDDLAVGAGVGVRYNLGFAPIRVDIATPVANRNGEAAFQIYVSIGQSF
ncbi:autotransporter assembly complex family protein [Phenylobacterium sp.]|uniref:autotransporter assembly complex protein TamA n=1 Tax=Phenylobacterium sp. TaxID=1871053 RepID=UPI00281218B1|nr:autotransporter assembly complex family protein [Phenylobacterium sp.]